MSAVSAEGVSLVFVVFIRSRNTEQAVILNIHDGIAFSHPIHAAGLRLEPHARCDSVHVYDPRLYFRPGFKERPKIRQSAEWRRKHGVELRLVIFCAELVEQFERFVSNASGSGHPGV